MYIRIVGLTLRGSELEDPGRKGRTGTEKNGEGQGVQMGAKKAAQCGAALQHLVADLKIPYGLERSFKVFERTLLANRFLLTIGKKSLSGDPEGRIAEICQAMGMPADYLDTFREHLPEVNLLHFGFEEGQTSCIYKAYLEFRDQKQAGPFTLHLAFKWDPFDISKRAVTTYTCYPFSSLEKIVLGVAAIFGGGSHRQALEIAEGILAVASVRIRERGTRYLEVTEEGNPRRSFDINLYNCRLRLEGIYPYLSSLCRLYSIPPGQFNTFYEGIRAKILGHLSGGIDREGNDFFTVYFGVEGH
jgi:hypothetical protein